MHKFIMLLVIGFAPVALTACGGSKAKGDAPAAEEVSAYDQLQAMPAEIDGEVVKVEEPIDGVDGLLAQAKALPETHKIKAATMSEVMTSALGGQGLAVPDSVNGKAKVELEAFVKNLTIFRAGLSAVPDRSTALATSLASRLATIPALATKVSSQAAVVRANPFSSKEEKEAAKKQQASVDSLQATAQGRIENAQKRLKAVPARAAEAMTKFAQGLQGMGITAEAISAIKQPYRDAKAAAIDVKNTAQKSTEASVDNAGKAVGVEDASGKTRDATKKALDK